MALTLTVRSPVGALVTTSLTGNRDVGCSLVIPHSDPPPSSRLMEVGT